MNKAACCECVEEIGFELRHDLPLGLFLVETR
jgi:hypothetical protein